MKKSKKLVASCLTIATATSLLMGCGKSTSDDSSKVLLNINGTEVPYSIGEFYAYNEQASYEAYYLANGYNIDWTSAYDDTKSVEELVKSEVLERIKMFYIVSEYAKEQGVTLSDDDQKEIEEYITTYLEGSEKVVAATHATKENLKPIYEMESYYNKGCDIIFEGETFEVSDDDIRQTDVYAVEIQESATDFPEDTANAILARVQAGEDITKVADAYALSAVEGNIGKGDFEEGPVEKACLALKTGESCVVEDEGVFLVLYCINDFDKEATDVVREDKISKMKSDKLQEFYDEYTKDMKITVDEDLWSKITFANSIFTEDDLEDILKNQTEDETTKDLSDELESK